jgi:hypothetical protein
VPEVLVQAENLVVVQRKGSSDFFPFKRRESFAEADGSSKEWTPTEEHPNVVEEKWEHLIMRIEPDPSVSITRVVFTSHSQS